VPKKLSNHILQAKVTDQWVSGTMSLPLSLVCTRLDDSKLSCSGDHESLSSPSISTSNSIFCSIFSRRFSALLSSWPPPQPVASLMWLAVSLVWLVTSLMWLSESSCCESCWLSRLRLDQELSLSILWESGEGRGSSGDPVTSSPKIKQLFCIFKTTVRIGV